MKKILIAIACATTIGAFAQGTFISENRNIGTTPVIDAPVINGVTGLGISGTAGSAQFYAGAAGAAASALLPVGPVYSFNTAANRAGYIVAGDTLTVPGVAGNATATVQLRAWVGTAASYDLATNRGSSPTLQVVLGGAGSPPGLPADPIGLQGFTTVPEPATMALAGIGAAALLFRRRKQA